MAHARPSDRSTDTRNECYSAGGSVQVEGDLDFRGTLGVAKEAPVGFRDVRLHFELDSDAPPEQVAKVLELTERYCVVYQTLRRSPDMTITHSTAPTRPRKSVGA